MPGNDEGELWTNLVDMLTSIQEHVKQTGEKVLASDSPGGYYGYETVNLPRRVWKITPQNAMFGHRRLNELIARDAFKTAKGRLALTKVLNSEPLELFEPLDQDVDAMSTAELRMEVFRLRKGIRQHRDATGHNLCWHVPELWDLLPDKVEPRPQVPPRAEFLAKCEEYHRSLNPRPV